jgi:hypothetical protein
MTAASADGLLEGALMTKLVFAAIAGLLLVSWPARASAQTPACAASPLRVGACFTVHGRLTACTSIPNARIWIIGTKRILGVEDATANPAGDQLLPGRLDTEMFSGTPCSKAAYGDFTVCPLTPSRPGVMQRVCVESAAKVVIQDR